MTENENMTTPEEMAQPSAEPAVDTDFSTEAPQPDESYFDVVMEAATVGDMLSAKRRLAQLYRSGTGVEQDTAEAVRWYSLSAIQAMNELGENPVFEKADAVYNILLELGSLHYELGDTSRAISTLLRIQDMIDNLPDEVRSAETDRWTQICSNRLGSYYERTARPQEAYRHFRRALDIALRVAENDRSEIAQDDLAVASYRVGFMDYLFRRDRTGIDRAYDIWGDLYEQTGKYDYRRKRGVIETLLATADTTEEPVLTLPKGMSLNAESTDNAGDGSAGDDTPAVVQTEEQIAPADSHSDSLSAELAEYIRDHGHSRAGTFARIRPIIDTLLIITGIALCIWGYFAGVFHKIFAFFR